MIGAGYMYAAPPMDLGDLKPHEPFQPSQPWTPERCREFIDKLMGADEFDVMRAIDRLGDAAQRRVFEWLRSRVESSDLPKPEAVEAALGPVCPQDEVKRRVALAKQIRENFDKNLPRGPIQQVSISDEVARAVLEREEP